MSWVARASTGDRDAVERLLEQHLPALRGYVERHGGGLVPARESAGDVVQSVCRELLERLADGRFRFDGEAQFKSWLYRAAVMKLMNRARYWRAGQRDANEVAGASEIAARSGMQATPSAEAELVEGLESFERAFEQLDDEQRAIIVSFYVERRSHAEIASSLGVSEAYSRTLLSRAISRLARFGSPAL